MLCMLLLYIIMCIRYNYSVTYWEQFVANTFYSKDVDECSSGTFPCNDNANCTNTIGSFLCNCQSGYTGNGLTCEGVQSNFYCRFHDVFILPLSS